MTYFFEAISLLFSPEDRATKPAAAVDAAGLAQPPNASESEEPEEYLMNLVDSPGHIDFSSDVSTATRLCDGALVVVDVLEGLCTQTHAVLFKALKERMRPCLILNKIDRLMIEMQLTPVEAFRHLRRIVENVNALAFTLLNSELLSRAEANSNEKDGGDSSVNPHINGNEDRSGESNGQKDGDGKQSQSNQNADIEDDPLVEEWTFTPEKGNVIFASALDCWGFGIGRFANLWAKKFGVNKNTLQKYFFDDYMFNPKTKKIVKCDPSDPTAQPMFASLILDPIWQIYDTAIVQQNPDKAAKMATKGVSLTRTYGI
jgi:ribosome assembly protein 1